MKPVLSIVCLLAAVFGGLALAGELAPGIAFGAFLVSGVCVVVLVPRDLPRPVFAAEPASRPRTDPLPRLRELVAALPDPAIVVDRESTIVICNDHALEMLGAARVGQNLSAALRAPVVLEALETVLETGEGAQVDYEQRVPIERRFEVYLSPLPAAREDGAPSHGEPAVLMLLRDLTRQERVERMRADFVAYASHELRTPLAALLGFIETLQGAARNDSKARGEFLELMRIQANRMTRLIDDLLSLSRIELNAHVRPAGVIDLEQAVRHVLEYLAPLAAEGELEIETDFRLDAVRVPGDWDELVQVVQNLVDNAIKYGQSGGRLNVAIAEGPTSAEGEATVDLSIRDFGPGIAPEHLPRLTERFYRVDVAHSRAKGGTGLGLAIVKHIVNRHHGRLLVDSTLGQGSTFTVRLPRAVAAPGEIRAAAG